MPEMIKRLVVGELETNCYLLGDEGRTVVIDPGGEASRIIKIIKESGLSPLYIINTHGHPDHIEADLKIKEAFNIPILMHGEDLFMLAHYFGIKNILENKEEALEEWGLQLIAEGKIINIGKRQLRVLHTPGHSRGSISLYMEREKILFSGDTLFADGVGRTDLPGGSIKDLFASLKRLMNLPPSTQVYPGHGEITTIEKERKNIENYF